MSSRQPHDNTRHANNMRNQTKLEESLTRQEPLILDPSSSSTTTSTFNTNNKQQQHGMVQRFWTSVKRNEQDQGIMTTMKEENKDNDASNSAMFLAQEASYCHHAGYLLKLGTRIVEFKRRFFLLTKPISYLYYFLSPQDVEPRGCINLQGATIQCKGETGIEIVLPNSSNQVVVLQARNSEMQQEWTEALDGGSFECCQQQLHQSRDQVKEQSNQISELTDTLDDLRKTHQETLDMKQMYKAQLEQLGQGMRLLTRHLVTTEEGETKDDDVVNDNNNEENGDEVKPVSTPDRATNTSRETSLLDSVDENDNVEELLFALDQTETMPTWFSSLFSACLQLKQQSKLASEEASSAVHDLNESLSKQTKLQKRMTKAEQYLNKLWQENCNLRSNNKRLTRDKKLLVKEVKSLMVAATETTTSTVATTTETSTETSTTTTTEATTQTTSEERLLNELEQHVMTSIKLHEELLSGNPSPQKDVTNHHAEGPSLQQMSFTPQTAASLMDTDSETDEEDSVAASLASLVQAGGQPEQDQEHAASREELQDKVTSEKVQNDDDSFLHTKSQQNGNDRDAGSQVVGDEKEESPLLALVDSDDVSSSSTASTTRQPQQPQPVITDTGTATSRLECPLADVGTQSKQNTKIASSVGRDGRVYHLTFYTKKIGIQFQKVPLPQNAPPGLLTHAMTSDLGHAVDPDGPEKTASELQRIASISRLAKDNNGDGQLESSCPVALPVDAVLVCGLVGFDPSTNPATCPQLGARLVAFDGMSVEVGPWTFESVRKAIQARGRPLTLSFRNDMLTAQQREILTQAIADVKERTGTTRTPISHPAPQHPGSTLSLPDSDSDRIRSGTEGDKDDQSSVSTMASVSIASDRQSNSGERVYTRRASPYSFSEAGSSSAVSSALGPLMANLMSGLSSNSDASPSPSIPNYLRRDTAESVENKAQHRIFEESLL